MHIRTMVKAVAVGRPWAVRYRLWAVDEPWAVGYGPCAGIVLFDFYVSFVQGLSISNVWQVFVHRSLPDWKLYCWAISLTFIKRDLGERVCIVPTHLCNFYAVMKRSIDYLRSSYSSPWPSWRPQRPWGMLPWPWRRPPEKGRCKEERWMQQEKWLQR